MMYDPNLQDFYERVARIKAGHASGARFVTEAGRGGARPVPRRGISGVRFLSILLFVALAVFGMKGVIHAYVGEATYSKRLDEMAAKGGVDAFGAVLMTVDPMSLWVSHQVRDVLPRGL